jgi:hypothetical protein
MNLLRIAKLKDQEAEAEGAPMVDLILRYHYSYIRYLVSFTNGPTSLVLPSNPESDNDRAASRWLRHNHPEEYHAILMNTLSCLRFVADPSHWQVSIPKFQVMFPDAPDVMVLEGEALDEMIIKDARAEGLEEFVTDRLKAKAKVNGGELRLWSDPMCILKT